MATSQHVIDPSDLQPYLKAGWWARGLSYIGVGVLSLWIASGTLRTPEDADQAGAIALVAESPGGWALLTVLSAGFFLFALWEAAAFTITDQSGTDVVLLRLGKVVGVVVYGSLAWTSATLAWRTVRGSGGTSGGGWTVESATLAVIDHPLGRIAVVVAAVVVLVVAVRRGRRVYSGEFSDDLQLDMSNSRERMIDRLGRVGEVGRTISFVFISYFLASAAWQGQGTEARGLDSSLREASESSVGQFAVAIVAVGMISYGIFCAFSAPHRDLRRT